MCTYEMRITVMCCQALEIRIEFVLASHLPTDVANVVLFVHVAHELIFIKKAQVAEFAEWVWWNWRRCMIATSRGFVAIPTMPVQVSTKIDGLLANEGRSTMEARVAELFPMHVPEVILQISERSKSYSFSRTCFNTTTVLKQFHTLSSNIIV
mmetsp:Transcript_117054/g.292034  ORF Transcript_117054/g.292034 Transcript_117054/m.292034 type:complete len:153 (-) Transcript_117054:100-558(-)